MSLSSKQLTDVCLLGHNDITKTCKYLRNDELDSSKWHCQKLIPEIKSKIDYQVEISLKKVPLGDNCKGYPILKNIIQGYDKD